MQEILSQQLLRDQVRDAVRASSQDWLESHVYKATLRRFPDGVELSVRDVAKERVGRPRAPDIPPCLLMQSDRSEEEQARRDVENHKRSIDRAKREVRWKCKCMRADHMLTFSYRENVQDLKRVKADWRKFCRMYKKRYPEFKYVVCLELQERGAWHLHVAVHGRVDIHWVRRCWWMTLGHQVEIVYGDDGKRHLRALINVDGEWVYRGAHESLGNVDVKGPSVRFGNRGSTWKTDQLSAYLSKYMVKSFDIIESGRRYWPSKEILKPLVEKLWLKAIDWVSAVKEAHSMVHELFSCSRMRIWASNDGARLWFSGSGIVCPF